MKWYYATSMKRLVISLIALVSLILIGSGAFVVYVASQPENASVASSQPVEAVKPEQKPPTAGELLRLVNAERAKVGVAPLVIDERLNQSAQKKADDMFTHNYFGHVSPVDGRHGYEYAHDVMPECSKTSENYFYELPKTTSEHALTWWRNSPPHIQAIKDPKYTKTGFGIANNSIVVEHFCVAI